MTFVPGSLRWRTLAVVIAAMVLSNATALWLFDRYITLPRVGATIGQFVSHVRTLGSALQTLPAAERDRFIERVAQNDGIRISPVRGDERMRPAADRRALGLLRERLAAALGPEAEVLVREGDAIGPDGRPRVLWIRLPAGDSRYWLAVPRTRVERDTALALVVWGLAGSGIAILATFFLVWRLNHPLQELARAARVLGRGGDPAPVAEAGPEEIRAVTRAFNQMKENLKKNERERATFLAGISHDLRTPLARMRLDVEMLEGRVEGAVQRDMVADLDEMNAIIDQFIDFTRSEAAERLSAVNLSELARACAERAARTGVQVSCELAEVPLAMLRPLAMQRLIDNLLVNAARHAGGPIVLRTDHADDRLVLAVLDRGPGIPPEMVERLKEPFTRRDEARSGTAGAGLGLAIVVRVAAVHGGELRLLPREGGGLEARVSLPAVAA